MGSHGEEVCRGGQCAPCVRSVDRASGGVGGVSRSEVCCSAAPGEET